MMDDRYERDRAARIRERAHRMWEEEGRPEGRSDVHWDKAAELVAIEDNYRLATEKVPTPAELSSTGEPIEPIEAVENLGEIPGALTDQGDEQPYPSRRPPAATSPAPEADAPKSVRTSGGGKQKAASSTGAREATAATRRPLRNGKAPPTRRRKSSDEKSP
jgi:hypothetical protein